MVERCVRDAEVAGSNPVASTWLLARWSSGQDDGLSRRKPGFDSRTGHEAVASKVQQLFTILLVPRLEQKASVAQSVEQRIRNAWVRGSNPLGSFYYTLQMRSCECRVFFIDKGLRK